MRSAWGAAASLAVATSAALWAAVSPASARPRGRLPHDATIRVLLQQRISGEKRARAIAVGVIDEAGARVVAVGDSGDARRPQVDGDTLFEIGSVTKVFTTALLADMVKRGEVGLDEPIRRMLPATLRRPSPGAGDITLRQLATHTSGLPRLPANAAFVLSWLRLPRNPYAHYARSDLLAYLEQYRPAAAAPHAPVYSNLGMGVLGEALACRAGLGYGDLLHQRVLKPLGMRSTFVVVPPARRVLLATGHNALLDPVSHWDLPAFAGAGALYSSANDMLRFLTANLRATPSLDPPTDHAGSTVARRAQPSGWAILRKGGEEILWHNGGTGGFRSFVAFERQSGTGVVVLSNSNDSVDDLGMHLLRPDRFPLAPRPRSAAGGIAITLLLTMTLRAMCLRAGAEREARATNWPWIGLAPMHSRLRVLTEWLELAVVVGLIYRLGAWPFPGGSHRVVLLTLLLVPTARFVMLFRRLPWHSETGIWAGLRAACRLAISLLLVLYALFCL